MGTFQIVLVGLFLVSTLVGYFLINNIPSLLHTPLMSGMNALSGVTLLGALVATAIINNQNIIGTIFGGLAIVCAVVNICCGFGITDKILRIITSKKEKKNV